jgi:hypothetical protein
MLRPQFCGQPWSGDTPGLSLYLCRAVSQNQAFCARTLLAFAGESAKNVRIPVSVTLHAKLSSGPKSSYDTIDRVEAPLSCARPATNDVVADSIDTSQQVAHVVVPLFRGFVAV